MKTTLTLVLSLLLVFVAQADTQFSVVSEFRDNVSSTIGGVIYENPDESKSGKVAVALHGLAHTGASYEKLAQSFFTTDEGRKFEHFVVFDMPGRGLSSLPSGLLFEQLGIEDYTNIFLDVLDYLDNRKLAPDLLIGHSMGALVVMQAQQLLIEENASLWEYYHVADVVVMAPVIVPGLPWALADSGTAAQLAGSFVIHTPELGYHLDIPVNNWLGLWFTNQLGGFVPGTPSPAEVQSTVAKDAFVTALQIVRAAPMTQVTSGIFGKGYHTRLNFIVFSEDPLSMASEQQVMFNYLVNGWEKAGFQVVSDPGAAHDAFISVPDKVSTALLP